MQEFRRTIGIIGAMDREVESIKDALEDPFTEHIAGADFTVGTYMGLELCRRQRNRPRQLLRPWRAEAC